MSEMRDRSIAMAAVEATLARVRRGPGPVDVSETAEEALSRVKEAASQGELGTLYLRLSRDRTKDRVVGPDDGIGL